MSNSIKVASSQLAVMEVIPQKFSSKDLKKGDSGFEVKHLQESLKQLGYNRGTSNGIFGSKTEAALKDFQSTNNDVNINGVFDKATPEFMSKILTER